MKLQGKIITTFSYDTETLSVGTKAPLFLYPGRREIGTAEVESVEIGEGAQILVTINEEFREEIEKSLNRMQDVSMSVSMKVGQEVEEAE